MSVFWLWSLFPPPGAGVLWLLKESPQLWVPGALTCPLDLYDLIDVPVDRQRFKLFSVLPIWLVLEGSVESWLRELSWLMIELLHSRRNSSMEFTYWICIYPHIQSEVWQNQEDGIAHQKWQTTLSGVRAQHRSLLRRWGGSCSGKL